jgi:hypothetical protein
MYACVWNVCMYVSCVTRENAIKGIYKGESCVYVHVHVYVRVCACVWMCMQLSNTWATPRKGGEKDVCVL